MTGNLWILLTAGGAVVAVFVALSLLADNYNLNNIKSRTVGDGSTVRPGGPRSRRSAAATRWCHSKWPTGGQAKTCRKLKVWCWAAATAEKAVSRRWWTAMIFTAS